MLKQLLSIPLLLLAGCVIPASLLERSNTPGQLAAEPPPDYWQGEGRYRQGEPGPGAPAPAGPSAQPGAVAAPPPLYAWDGGVVDGAPQGVVTEESGTPRGIEAPPAGRLHIIELYQQVLDERDALVDENERLNALLEKTSAALEEERALRAQLETRVAALEEGQRGLLADNQDLAARLTTAQIRRLEAEKLLLETRLEIQRARAAEAAEAQQRAAAPARGEKPRKPAASEPAPEDEGGGA
jgi:hypothetical protein